MLFSLYKLPFLFIRIKSVYVSYYNPLINKRKLKGGHTYSGMVVFRYILWYLTLQLIKMNCFRLLVAHVNGAVFSQELPLSDVAMSPIAA